MDGKKGGKEADGPTSMRMRPDMDAMRKRGVGKRRGGCLLRCSLVSPGF